MTDLDQRLRKVAADLTVGPDAPDFADLHTIGTTAPSSNTRRGPLMAVAAAVAVVLVIASVALVETGTIGGEGSAATPADHDVVTPEPTEAPDPWSISVMLEECRTAPLASLSSGGRATIRFVDSATHEPVEVDTRAYCEATVPLTPDPEGDMGAAFGYRNGELIAQYFEKTREVVGGKTIERGGAAIPPEEAAQRLAQQKASQPK